MNKIIKLKCENCGNEWEINLEEEWEAVENPYGVCLYPAQKLKHKNPLIDSIILQCKKCNQCRKIWLNNKKTPLPTDTSATLKRRKEGSAY